MKPEAVLAQTKQMERVIKEMCSKSVKVGLPKEKVGGKVYGNGWTVLDNGVVHEYGTPDIPRRSFLRTPFLINEKAIRKFIAAQSEKVLAGDTTPEAALNLIGIKAQKISLKAFDTRGYGKWPDISDATKAAKGSSKPLIDRSILRQSITWVVTDG